MPIRIKTEGSTEIISNAGKRLSAIRRLGGVTQEALCERLEVDQSTYSKWEKGKRLPDVLVLIKFASRFKTSLDFLYRGAPVGMHPDLVDLLRKRYPELVADTPSDTDRDTDTALTSYRAAIVLGEAE